MNEAHTQPSAAGKRSLLALGLLLVALGVADLALLDLVVAPRAFGPAQPESSQVVTGNQAIAVQPPPIEPGSGGPTVIVTTPRPPTADQPGTVPIATAATGATVSEPAVAAPHTVASASAPTMVATAPSTTVLTPPPAPAATATPAPDAAAGSTTPTITLRFDTANANLKLEARELLGPVLRQLRQNPQLRVRVVGHTDARGSVDINRWLSKQRALSIVKLLTTQGIEMARIEAIGRASEEPVDERNTPEAWSTNRRVELFIR